MKRSGRFLSAAIALPVLAFAFSGCGSAGYSVSGSAVAYVPGDYEFGDYGEAWPAYYDNPGLGGAFYARPPFHQGDDRGRDRPEPGHPGNPQPRPGNGGGRSIPSIPNSPRPSSGRGGGGGGGGGGSRTGGDDHKH